MDKLILAAGPRGAGGGGESLYHVVQCCLVLQSDCCLVDKFKMFNPEMPWQAVLSCALLRCVANTGVGTARQGYLNFGLQES